MEPSVMYLKTCYLGFMVRRLLGAYTGKVQCDDRDNYGNKRIDTAGALMALLFRQVYRAQLKSFGSTIYRLCEAGKLEYTNIGELFVHKKITGAFK